MTGQKKKVLKTPSEDEVVIHMEAIHPRSGEDAPVVLAEIWVVSGLILMAVGIAMNSHPGSLLVWVR
ncbi:MAG: hypothetical protein ACYCYP_12570 [Leptospirales bacterium]